MPNHWVLHDFRIGAKSVQHRFTQTVGSKSVRIVAHARVSTSVESVQNRFRIGSPKLHAKQLRLPRFEDRSKIGSASVHPSQRCSSSMHNHWVLHGFRVGAKLVQHRFTLTVGSKSVRIVAHARVSTSVESVQNRFRIGSPEQHAKTIAFTTI